MAKAFKFRLEPFLTLKSHKVREAKESLNLVLNLRLKKEQEIEEKESYLKELLSPKKGKSSASELQAEFYHKNLITEEIQNLEKEKQQLLEIEAIRRRKLSEAMKEEKTLEKLKEKKKEAYNEELIKEETKILDEVAGIRHEKSSKI
jgi:flagellar export protein FliJ